jgi:hypothetical protein
MVFPYVGATYAVMMPLVKVREPSVPASVSFANAAVPEIPTL